MLLCLDVHYEEHAATTGCVGFEDWRDARATMELVVRTQSAPEPYEPGEFFRREQPHLVDAIERVRRSACVDVVLVDGHAWLTEGRPGLGARLHEVLGGSIAVVGIAKNEFAGGIALPVLRGESLRPKFRFFNNH